MVSLIAVRRITRAQWLGSLLQAAFALCLSLFAVLAYATATATDYTIDQAQRRAWGQPRETAQSVRLPDAWNAAQRSGDWVYTTAVSLAEAPAEPWGLFIPRAGNRFKVSVNGTVVGQLGSFSGDDADYSKRPHYLFVATDLLHAGTNTLEFQVQGELARNAGLSSVQFGPDSVVRPAFFWRELFQTWGSFAIVLVSLALLFLASTIGWGVRDKSFGYFAMACLFCAARTGYALVITLPLDYRVGIFLYNMVYAGYVISITLFCLEALSRRPRWSRWLMVALGTFGVVSVGLFAFAAQAWAWQLWTTGLALYTLALTLFVISLWWRDRTPVSSSLALASAISLAMGLYDHLVVFYVKDGYASLTLVRFSLPVFLVAMVWVMMRHYAEFQRRERMARERAGEEIRQHTSSLISEFETQKRAITAVAQKTERERLIMDLHDGLGLQLNTLLRTAEQTEVPGRAEMVAEIRTAIEQLRMLVDNSSSFDGSFAELLGQLRFRMEGRLKRFGITLAWQVLFEPMQFAVDPDKATALQHLLFEIITNSMKHSGAKTVSVNVSLDQATDCITLIVEDDGVGFDTRQVSGGVGSRSIIRRVADLRGELRVRAQPGGGCQYWVQFPAPRPITAG